MKVYTRSVGIRDLRANLSNYLKQVRSGEKFTITDHGQAIATLQPIEAPSRIEALLAEGIAKAPSQSKPLPTPVEIGGTVSDLVAEQRR
ncbi:type II toxin-antitoxin system prevent-host-death family antitoxin [Actinomycetaceae bacterium L2_0104]